MALYFADFEAFQHGQQKFQLVEMCVLEIKHSSNKARPLVMLFSQCKPWNVLTHSERRTYAYQTRKLHKLPWKYNNKVANNDESTCFSPTKVFQTIDNVFHPRPKKDIFLVFGEQKLSFFRENFPMYNWVQYTQINSFHELSINDPILKNILQGEFHDKDHCSLFKCIKLASHWASPHKIEIQKSVLDKMFSKKFNINNNKIKSRRSNYNEIKNKDNKYKLSSTCDYHKFRLRNTENGSIQKTTTNNVSPSMQSDVVVK